MSLVDFQRDYRRIRHHQNHSIEYHQQGMHQRHQVRPNLRFLLLAELRPSIRHHQCLDNQFYLELSFQQQRYNCLHYHRFHRRQYQHFLLGH